MTLAFSTQLNKVPTYFVAKILKGLELNKLITYKDILPFYVIDTVDRYKSLFVKPKIHTIRTDKKERWKSGNLIHFVINNRTPNRYQFAPVLKCVSTQKIKIYYWYNPKTEKFDDPDVYIDDKLLNFPQVEELAINDGFESTKDFFAYFNTGFSGKIIHWTNKKY